jgi:hypothetical protein
MVCVTGYEDAAREHGTLQTGGGQPGFDQHGPGELDLSEVDTPKEAAVYHRTRKGSERQSGVVPGRVAQRGA